MVESCLVVGGAGGIGAAVCRQLAAGEIAPIIAYRSSRARAEAIAAETGGHSLALDLADDGSIEAALGWLANRTPDLMGAVLAASPPPEIGPFGRIEADDMALQWRVNVEGPRRLLAGLVRQCLRQRGNGVVIAVLSRAMGLGDAPAASNMGAYIIAKHGLRGVLAATAADYPWLTVDAVYPGFTETPMLAVFDDRFLEAQKAGLPGGRFATPDEVACDIVNMISDFRRPA